MSSRGFHHTGEVVAVEGESLVRVSLAAVAACEGCKAKGRCGVSEASVEGSEGSERRVMSIYTEGAKDFRVGDTVDVAITYRVGMIAVVMTYVIPLVVFVGSLVALLTIGVDEGVAALATFAVVGLYYWVIYLMRDRFERIVEFDIHKK